jgi:hypothetical protein
MQDLTHLMIDGETLAVSPNSVLRSLSIVAFRLDATESLEDILARTLTVWVAASPQLEAGREVDEDTLDFWEKQKDRFREGTPGHANACQVLGTHGEDVSMEDAADIITAYIRDVAPTGLVFSRGSNFDFPIVESIFKQIGKPLPYNTWKVACSKSIIRFVCQDDKEVEAGLVNGLKSNHTSSYDVAVEVLKLQRVFQSLNSD